MLVNKIIAFIKRDFKIEASYRLAFILRLGRIFTTVLTFYFISKLFGNNAPAYLGEYGGEYFPFVLLGIAFSEYLTMGLHSISESIRQEQISGTLEAVLSSPNKISTVIIGAGAWDFIFTTISVVIYLVFGTLLFNFNLSRVDISALVVILILSLISFYSIGMISAAFIIVLKKGSPLVWFMGICFSLMGGTYFPVTIMPKYLQFFSYLLPPTYSLKSIRLILLKGYTFGMLLPETGALIIFSVLLLPLSIIALKIALRKTKMDGSLLYY